ncbi:hypothetical protein HDV00_004817 [Rhizophlyctis rosea]|nr:hypothetical protein HDV00_004817 [Rhizophlyctis rosea]
MTSELHSEPDWVAILATAGENLRAALAKYETYNPPEEEHSTVQDVVSVACDEINSFTAAVTDMRNGEGQIIDDKLAAAVRNILKDVPHRVDTVVRRELEKVSHNLVGDIAFIFEDEDPSTGEAALTETRHQVIDASKRLNVAAQLSQALNDFLEAHVITDARNTYRDMVNATLDKAGQKLEERIRVNANDLQNLIKGYEAVAVPARTPARPTPAHPPTMPARPSPVATEPPAVVPRPQQPGVPRPQSAVENVLQRPVPPIKPRPQTVAVPTGQEYTDTTPSQPSPAGPESDAREPSPEAPETPTSATSGKGVAGRNIGLMADLNRMLAGPPPKVKRHTVEYSDEQNHEHEFEGEEHAATADEQIGGAVAVQEGQLVGEPELAVAVAEKSQPAEVPVAEEHPPAAPARALLTETLPASPSQQPLGGNLSRSPSKLQTSATATEKEKPEKAQKAHKGGFRNMLTSLTKSRPKVKKGKAASPAKEVGEEEALEAASSSQESLPEEEARSAALADAASIPAYSQKPPTPQPQVIAQHAPQLPPVESAHAESLSDEIQAAGSELVTAEESSTAPADQELPSVPVKPRKPQPTGAMSALASVMRGGTQRKSTYETLEEQSTEVTADDKRRSTLSEVVSAGDRSSIHGEHSPLEETSRYPPLPAARKPSVPLSPARKSQVLDETVGLPPSPSRASPPPVRPRMPKPVTSPRTSVILDDSQAHSPVSPKPQPPVPSPISRTVTGELPISPIPASPSDAPPSGAPAVRPRPPKPVPSYAQERPGSSYSVTDRPTSTYSTATATTDRPISTYSTNTAGDRPHSLISENAQSEISARGSVEEHEGVGEAPAETKAPPPRPPKKIPGVFATSHGALGALAAAVRGGAPPRGARPTSMVAEKEEMAPVAQHETEPEDPPEPQAKPRPQVCSTRPLLRPIRMLTRR